MEPVDQSSPQSKSPIPLIFIGLLLVISLSINALVVWKNNIKPDRPISQPPINNAPEVNPLVTENGKLGGLIEIKPRQKIISISPSQDKIFGWQQNLEQGTKPIIVNIDSKQISPFADADPKGGEWAGRGTTSPLTSPKFHYIAYLQADGNIAITNSLDHAVISEEAIKQDETSWGTQIYLTGWSPDETKLIYYVLAPNECLAMGCVTKPDLAAKPSVVSGYYLIDFQSGKKYLLPQMEEFVEWTADGESLIGTRMADKKTSIWKLNLTTGAMERLTTTEGSNYQVRVNPDGKSIIYMVFEFDENGSSNLWKIDLSTNSQEKLLEVRLPDRRQMPVFSPDGSKILLMKEGPDTTCDNGSSGCPQGSVSIFDPAIKSERVIDVPFKRFFGWIDQDRALILGGRYQGSWSLQILTISTGKTDTLLDQAVL